MFGLMKSRSCSLTAEQKLNRRLHYCGTCKTMGRLYGQRSRFLLNNDAVFLAELLSAISGADGQLAEWDRAYQSYNCLSLPVTSQAMPLPLQYAAAGALAIADFKVADQIADAGRFPWAVAASVFSSSFSQASARLAEWGFPVDELRACSIEQSKREATCSDDHAGADGGLGVDRAAGDGSVDERSRDDWPAGNILAYLEEPTDMTTALFFSHGARLVGRPELQDAMREIGFKLGSLIYLLDAYEDYEKDSRTGAFNALRAAFHITEDKLSVPCRESAASRIWQMAAEIEAGLDELPIPRERAEVFGRRLRSNLAHRLGRRLPVLRRETALGTQRTACSCSGAPIGFSDRWRAALRLGRSIVDKRRSERPGEFAFSLQAPFVFVSVMAVALLFPRQARTVSSYRECIGIALNLMFVTALARSVLVAPLRPLLFSTPAGPGEPPGGAPGQTPGVHPPPQYTVGPPGTSGEPVAPPPAPKRGCSVCCCDADCCDGCDCCCECGDCCSGCDC